MKISTELHVPNFYKLMIILSYLCIFLSEHLKYKTPIVTPNGKYLTNGFKMHVHVPV